MRSTFAHARREITQLQRTSLYRRTAEVVAVDHTLDPVRVTVRYSPTDTATPTIECHRHVTPEPGETVEVLAPVAGRPRIVGIVSAARWNVPEYENSWASYTTGDLPALRWRVEPGRVVRLDGAVAGGTLAATIFTLPETARPLSRVRLPAVSNNSFCVVDVAPDGSVAHVTGGSNAWLAMCATFPLG